jgi:pyruvyl transferase EpsO
MKLPCIENPAGTAQAADGRDPPVLCRTRREDLEAVGRSLKQELGRILAELVPPGSAAVFLDYPVHSNLGDHLIRLATEKWLRDAGIEVAGLWSLQNFRYPPLPEETVILLQGGGNLGDLYPQQPFRERVVRRYPRHRIVFLPQAVHYRDPGRAAAAAALLSAHPRLTILLRDGRSLEAARRHFPGCDLRLAPDMASWLHPWEEQPEGGAPGAVPAGTLYLLRGDRELRRGQATPDCGPGWRGDWRDLLGHRYWRLRLLKAAGFLLPAGTMAAMSRREAERAASLCAARFREHERVVSSRLHGFLLACLLGIPGMLLDNSYGKNHAYFQTWFRRSIPSADD